MILRNWWSFALALALSLFFASVFLLITAVSGVRWSDIFLVTFVSGFSLWVNWKISLGVFIKLEGDSLVMVNYFKRCTIPVSMAERVKFKNYISVVTNDGREYASSAFSESLFGLLIGNPASRAAGSKIQSFLEASRGAESASGSGEDGIRVSYELNPVVAIFATLASFVFYFAVAILIGGFNPADM